MVCACAAADLRVILIRRLAYPPLLTEATGLAFAEAAMGRLELGGAPILADLLVHVALLSAVTRAKGARAAFARLRYAYANARS